MDRNTTERKSAWWYGRIAYQIYLKSFSDSNGDGIGDLRGVISRLDYLKDLGVDILWLSPCYPSPWADHGYDISDYYDIDPRYGTLSDMDELIAEAGKRGMRILLDLVANHCSDEHAWFRKACMDPEGRCGRYFYIEDIAPSGKLPCNHRSVFGGSVWEPLPGHPDKVYLHTFHKKQPDLNWENPEVRENIYRNAAWWLDRGIAGFRIDAVTYIKKELPFADEPADRELAAKFEGSFSFERSYGPDFSYVQWPSTLRYIGDYAFNFYSFKKFTMKRLGWYSWDRITTEDYKQCVMDAQRRAGKRRYLSNVIENHDRPRAANRYLPPEGRTEAGKKCLALAYFMLRGIPFIYQGQEIGMENYPFRSAAEFDDVTAIDEYRVSLAAGLGEDQALEISAGLSRDNARTPVQWDETENAGFTTGMPWLPVNPGYTRINVREQEERPDSLLNFYRAMASLRKEPKYFGTFAWGDFEPAW